MSRFKKFQDFLKEQKAHKWTLPEPTEEPKDNAHKGKYVKPDDYYAPGAKKNPGLLTADDDRGTPFGDRGAPGMTPKNAQPLGEKPAGAPKKLKSKAKMPKKMKNEAFLNRTSDLSDKDFVKTMVENVRTQLPAPQKIHSLYGREFVPEPAETMKYVASLMLNNESMMTRMVREIKRQGGLVALVNEIFAHPETFEQLIETANQETPLGARLRRKLVEAVAEPRGEGGSPAGPNGASAGPLMQQKLGGGMNAAAPGAPPSMEGDDNPTGDDSGMDLLDDDGAGDEDDKEDGDEDGDDGKHIHFHGGKHIHHHHHGSDDFDDEHEDDDDDDDEHGHDEEEGEDEDLPPIPQKGQPMGGKPSGGETGSGIGSGQLTTP